MTTLARIVAAIALLAGAGAALPLSEAPAAGSSSGGDTASEAGLQDVERGRQAVETGDWERAARHFERATGADPHNADAFNLLAYSYRHLGRLDDAFAAYRTALDLDPRHRGAHEYVGEAYLLIGNPAMAERHLAILREICAGPCEEAEELAAAIARFGDGEAQ